MGEDWHGIRKAMHDQGEDIRITNDKMARNACLDEYIKTVSEAERLVVVGREFILQGDFGQADDYVRAATGYMYQATDILRDFKAGDVAKYLEEPKP